MRIVPAKLPPRFKILGASLRVLLRQQQLRNQIIQIVLLHQHHNKKGAAVPNAEAISSANSANEATQPVSQPAVPASPQANNTTNSANSASTTTDRIPK